MQKQPITTDAPQKRFPRLSDERCETNMSIEKKKYEKPVIEIIAITSVDAITASDDGFYGNEDESGFGT